MNPISEMTAMVLISKEHIRDENFPINHVQVHTIRLANQILNSLGNEACFGKELVMQDTDIDEYDCEFHLEAMVDKTLLSKLGDDAYKITNYGRKCAEIIEAIFSHAENGGQLDFRSGSVDGFFTKAKQFIANIFKFPDATEKKSEDYSSQSELKHRDPKISQSPNDRYKSTIHETAKLPLKNSIINELELAMGTNISFLDIEGLTDVVKEMIICTGSSEHHVRSIAQDVINKINQHGYQLHRLEGMDTGEWVLIDLGELVVHIMQPGPRAFYNLEEKWAR